MSDKSPKSPRILIIDDEPAVCQVLAEALRVGGFEVDGATTAEEAMAAALQAKPDLVVADLCLGAASGLDVIDELRERLGDVPTVIITGHGDPDKLSDASRRRPVEVLNKPIDLARLRNAIGEELQQQEHKQRLQRRHHRLRQLTRKINRNRKFLTTTCNDLTATCRNLQGHVDRQEAVIRYQTDLLASEVHDDIFRHMFRLFVERSGMVFGAGRTL